MIAVRDLKILFNYILLWFITGWLDEILANPQIVKILDILTTIKQDLNRPPAWSGQMLRLRLGDHAALIF